MGANAEVVKPDPAFRKQVEEKLGKKIPFCFHCNKCSSGCPVTFAMDFLPNKVVRMVQMGMKDQVLRSSTIWLCASCQTCTTRCPNDVDIAALMDGLREMTVSFHDAFLAEVEKRGRVFEVGMLARFKLKTRKEGGLFKDAELGWEMFKKGKLKLLPDKISKREEVREIFRKSGA